MRKFSILVGVIMFLNFVGCSQKSSDNSYYERANKVSKEALSELDKE